jgi:aldose 1-epimerase
VEDPRISRMYASLLRATLDRLRFSIWQAAVMRSGLLTMIAVVVVLIVATIAFKERGRGNLHKLETHLKPKPLNVPATIQPGGQDPIFLERAPISGGTLPEFLSATVLPGRGMNVLQITAFIPDKGEVPLLVSPSLDAATRELSGVGGDAKGSASLEMGGALEVPWANRLAGVQRPDGQGVLATWQGRTMALPAVLNDGKPGAKGGLLLKRRSDSATMNVMPDGGQAESVYRVGDFDGHWPSNTEITGSVLLSSKAVEIKVVARNAGDVPEPMGIGWVPRFSIVSGDRTHATLRLPDALRVEKQGDRTGLPTGKLLPVAGTVYDFTDKAGARLGTRTVDDSFVHLRQGLLDNGPTVELRDTTAKFGLRLTALTTTIKTFRVYAPASEQVVSIAPEFNYDDPFGHEWPKDEDTGMVVLQPGRSVQWKVRLELFPLRDTEASPF